MTTSTGRRSRWRVAAALAALAIAAYVGGFFLYGFTNKSGMLDYAPPFHAGYDIAIIDLRNSGRSGDALSTGGLREQDDVRAMLRWLAANKGSSPRSSWGTRTGQRRPWPRPSTITSSGA